MQGKHADSIDSQIHLSSILNMGIGGLPVRCGVITLSCWRKLQTQCKPSRMKSSVRYRKYSQFYQRDTKIRMKVSQNDSKKSCLQPTASRSFTVYVLRPSTTTCNYGFNTFFLMMVNVLQAQATYSAIKKQVKYISLMIYCPPFLNYFPCKG